MQVHFFSQFHRHLVETLNGIRYAVHRFETFTYNSVDRGPGKCELQTNSMSIPRRVGEQKEIPHYSQNPRRLPMSHLSTLLSPTLLEVE